MSGLDEKGRYCTCNSKTNPCIVCSKPKFIDPEWLKRKIEEEPDGMEVGAGFEIFSAPASASATPADVGELVERTLSGETVAGVPVLGWMWEVDAPLAGTTRQTVYHWSTPPSNVHVTRLVDATALERVTRERDEARRLFAARDEQLTAEFSVSSKMARIADAAEAKLAEARKVIEPFAEASIYHAAFGDERPVRADGDVKVKHLRAARRFLEETK